MKLIEQLLSGTVTSIEVFFLTLIMALPLGFLVALGRMSKVKVVRVLVDTYIQIMRGTPLLLQLLLFYFAPYYIFNASLPRFASAILAFVLNYAAYFGEIYRSGLQALDNGQREAAKVLGFSKSYTFIHIVLPQVVKNVLPSVGNEVITLVKDTALASTIGVVELFRIAQTASSREFSTMPIFIAGVFYFIMNYLVSRVFDLLEKKMQY